MYRTGDLARWREDGEIEYLGRIDTQVKIRGLRIELAEIEGAMAGFPGMQLVAVADKRDEAGRQYLVGYYTSEAAADERLLRQHLGKSLPRYMVPNYFVHLDAMPMTASGKTDRKRLPVPEISAADRECAAPTNDREAVLCEVLGELFEMERVGVTEDFFDLGGDSLRAIEYVTEAHVHGVDFSLQDVFDYPTAQLLSAHIDTVEEKEPSHLSEEFDKYVDILNANVIDEASVPYKESLGDTFLTGGTGFLGAHIIDAFLKKEEGVLYCLVRGGEERLKETLRYYFGNGYDTAIGSRIRCVVGDITDENLDTVMPATVQTVIHAAATVKHYGSYEYFKRINVEGTARVAECARRRNARLIHVSTVSVSGNTFGNAFDANWGDKEIDFDERCLYRGQLLDNVYARSKLEAECAVFDAILCGLDAKVVRVGYLSNRKSDLKFQPNYQTNALLKGFKAILELGYLPDYMMDGYAEFSPIDQTAEGILLIAEYADSPMVFHLNSNKGLYLNRLVPMLNELGIRMDVLPGREFNLILTV